MPYFAQIRAFLTDQYGEKSAVVTWLIPIDSNYAKRIQTAKDFDPDMFLLGDVYIWIIFFKLNYNHIKLFWNLLLLGPAEEYPRPLKCLEFVCRLVDYSSKYRRSNYFNNCQQFKSDLQRHKYLLNDLAESNLRLITKKSITDQSRTEYEIKWNWIYS